MGYELHITCAESWYDAETTPIAPEVWNRVVDSDPSLSVSAVDCYGRKDGKGGVVRVPAVYWTEDPEVVFWFDQGEVTVKNPSDATIVKMLELASRLGARVFGDDEEEILASPAPPGYTLQLKQPELPPPSTRPWWKLW